VQEGKDPRGLVRRANGPIDTYAHNTSIPVPQAATAEDDNQLIIEVEREILAKTLDGSYLREADYRYEK
jgi:hypothetical protein